MLVEQPGAFSATLVQAREVSIQNFTTVLIPRVTLRLCVSAVKEAVVQDLRTVR